MSRPVRVRIAPSPTGYLHLGTVRTALFNYLFAKQHDGQFVVRIEDTDRGRSLPIYEQDILEGLKDSGLLWDEGPDTGGEHGPYRQSERGEIYERYVGKLLDEKKAYWCFCSKEDLDAERKAMLAQGLFPKYSGRCRSISREEAEKRRSAGEKAVLRLYVSEGRTVSFSDLIRGEVRVESSSIGDFVIAKSERELLYNLAVVIDDHEMEISHVIRGEDHISNTPRQILIHEALGIEPPLYAHLPLILSPDKSKLSKRALETSFREYLSQGYLPQALINFLVLLGWHPDDDQEIFSLDEMIQKFSLKRVSKSGAVFSLDKLEWFNAYYIKHLPFEELLTLLWNFIPPAWKEQKERVAKILAIERTRLKTLSEFEHLASFFFVPEEYDVELLIWQKMDLGEVKEKLTATLHLLKDVSVFDVATLEATLMPYAEEQGRGEVLWPLRVALSGRKKSPSPFEIMSVLGKEETMKRITRACEKIDAYETTT